MTATINRPPLHQNFEVPARENLLKLRRGDHVKLIFDLPNGVERMWVRIRNTDIDYTDLWEGELDNEPFGGGMELGEIFLFHPFDIIDFIINEGG